MFPAFRVAALTPGALGGREAAVLLVEVGSSPPGQVALGFRPSAADPLHFGRVGLMAQQRRGRCRDGWGLHGPGDVLCLLVAADFPDKVLIKRTLSLEHEGEGH